MKRSQAASLVDELRTLPHHGGDPAANLLALLSRYGLEPLKPCDGEAHSNAHIDNCMRCAPRWGFVGPKEPVT